MNRRTFLGTALSTPILAAVKRDKFDAAAAVLAKAAADGRIQAASLCVRHGKETFARPFGAAASADAMFLLASITKTLTAAAVVTLADRGKLRLEDPVAKFIPEFSAGPRSGITVAQLLTHVSGLPDQLPENQELRKRSSSTPAPSTATPAWASCWRPKWPSGSPP